MKIPVEAVNVSCLVDSCASVANGAVSNNNLPDVCDVIFRATLFVSRNMN